MTQPLMRFAWSRPRQGVEVRFARIQGEGHGNETGQASIPVLWARRGEVKLRGEPGWEAEWEDYAPLETFPRPYVEFANLPLEAEAFAAFASRYGLLGIGAPKSVRSHRWPTGEGRYVRRVGDIERAVDWTCAVLELRTALVIHALAEGGDRDKLEQLTEIRDGWAELRRPYDELPWELLHPGEPLERWRWDVLNAPGAWPRGETGLAAGDVLTGARLLVQSWIDWRLREHVMFGIWPVSRRRLRFAIGAQPDSLLTALWLQFAEAVTVGPAPRRCDRCGTWFGLDPSNKRGHGRFCSTRCRMAEARRRWQAQKLAAEGKKLGPIARILGEDVSRVRRMLGSVSGRPRRRRGRRASRTLPSVLIHGRSSGGETASR